jgi:DMSO/TMAO reductase YedYZ molybdopterin-dependent catalytic subunit
LTNLRLLLALLVTFATGVGAVATGSSRGAWIAIAHGIAAMVVILLIPWKARVVQAGLPLHPYGRWMSLLLAVLTVGALFFGLAYATGVVRSVFGQTGLWLHVLLALALVPLLLWHTLARPVRPRRTDVSRRALLRTGALAIAGAGLYLATSTVVSLAQLPGRTRRFTGSYETGSFDPTRMPNTIWLLDTPPVVDPSQWRLTIVDDLGEYSLDLDQLTGLAQTRRETIDCTSGWYAEQDWTGAPVSRLIRSVGNARSLYVRSVTGYWVRLPVDDLPTLLLATDVGRAPLSIGHGYPLRLVAPGRRGYWWVKWVERIELQRTPWWWQPPFPVT